MRKKPILPAGLLRRLEAGVLGLAVLWAAATPPPRLSQPCGKLCP